MVSCHCKNNLHQLLSGDWSKILIKINALVLHIPFDDQSCLVSNNIAEFITLQFENLFQTDFLRWK
jgi:hypothetical protein